MSSSSLWLSQDSFFELSPSSLLVRSLITRVAYPFASYRSVLEPNLVGMSPGSLLFATMRPIHAPPFASHMASGPAFEAGGLQVPTLEMPGRSTFPAYSLTLFFGRLSSSRFAVFSSSRFLIPSTCSRVNAALPLRTIHLPRSLDPLAVQALRRACPFAPRSSASVSLDLMPPHHQSNFTSLAPLAISGSDQAFSHTTVEIKGYLELRSVNAIGLKKGF